MESREAGLMGHAHTLIAPGLMHGWLQAQGRCPSGQHLQSEQLGCLIQAAVVAGEAERE